MPVLDTSGYEFHEPPISWGRIIIGLGDEEVTLQIGKMLREAFNIGMPGPCPSPSFLFIFGRHRSQLAWGVGRHT